MILDDISVMLHGGKNGFTMVSPGFSALAKARLLKALFTIKPIASIGYKVLKHETEVPSAIGEYIGIRFIGRLVRPLSYYVTKGHMMAQYIKRNTTKINGVGGRTWISMLDAGRDGRIVKPLTIIYHDALRAGKHLDIHIGHLSLIMRVSGKPVENKITYNSNGELTQAAKEALLAHVRAEIKNNSRVPQNLDHSLANAKCTWNAGERGLTGYGAGNTRQIVAEDQVEFYHIDLTNSLHMYAPLINRHQGLYLYKIFEGKETGTPVCIWGNLIPRDKNFNDRLHLKMIDAEKFDIFMSRVDKNTITRKYDGASTYFNGNGEGMKYWSPRISKVTGHRIEYTFKVPELSMIKSSHAPEGMGEMMFWKHIGIGHLISSFVPRGIEGVTWKYLTAAEIGGVLNSSKIRSRDIHPELKLYRIDKWDGENVVDLPFFKNRELQKELSNGSMFMSPVTLIPSFLSKLLRWEGLVGVPKDKSINEGLKIKWWGDDQDWKVKSVNLYMSEKDNVAGVVWFQSLESDKYFKLGPGQIGTAEECIDIIQNPENYLDRVAKVSSRHGHEGRASKLQQWHLDK